MGWTSRGERRIEKAYVIDGLVALLLFALITTELVIAPESGSEPANVLALVLAASFTWPYAAHRAHPVAALVVSCLAVVAYSA
ncbi:MAG: hypothetical protein ACXWDL_12985, partial [Nocardioides sp.]